MSIKIYITESQQQFLILEKQQEKISENLKNNENFAKKIFQEVSNQTGLDFKFLFTWGAGIGAFLEPVSDFVNGEFPHMSESSVYLLLAAVFCTIFLESFDVTKNLIIKIKEKNLKSEFTTTFKKAYELKSVFVEFLESLGVSMNKLVNMLSYTFIIPILSILVSLVETRSMSSSDIRELSIRLASFGVLTISSKIISIFLKKLFKRFENVDKKTN
jgi:hypothetical protein